MFNGNYSINYQEDDYVVYVDDISNPSNIVGYRDNETWYNASGLQISDPQLLAEAAGGAIHHMLKIQLQLSGDIDVRSAFEDYQPETVFMPRIAFSFPISDEAQFFAIMMFNCKVLPERK